MATYAQVENNVVVNVVDATQEWIDQQTGEWIRYDESNPCAIGWAVENGTCVVPPPPPPPIPSSID